MRPSTSVDMLYSQVVPVSNISGREANLGHHLGIGLILGHRLGVAPDHLHGRVPERRIGQPGGVAEQILHRHRPFGRHTLGADRAIGEFRQILGDWGGDLQLAFFRQDHRCGRSQGLGHRGDPEDRVELHRRLGLAVAPAEGLGIGNMAATGDQYDRPGDQVALDILPECRREAGKTLCRQPDFLRTIGLG